MHARRLRLVTVLVTLLAFVACGKESPPDTRPNVLLISLDTVRADRVGCYGYAPAETPNLDALAARGVRFERAYAHTPFTLPSHATLLTGIHPSGHGVHVNFEGAIHPDATSLSEVFAKAGYATGAFVACGVLDRRFGLARGFQTYDDLSARPLSAGEQVERPGGEVTQAALRWLESNTKAPFFGWVHYYDAHDPYQPPEGFRDFKDPYDGEISFVDAQVGLLTAALARLGKLENTFVVVVADHGEAFGEHGELGHGLLVYDTTMRVPMIFAGPAPLRAGGVVHEPAGLVDVHPTLLALLGWPGTSKLEGRSLAPALRGETLPGATLQLESEHPYRYFGWSPLYGVLSGPWKYIRAPEEELFNLVDDPGETKNVGAQQQEVLARLARTLTEMRASGVKRDASAVHIGAGAKDMISKLGYVEGGDAQGAEAASGLKDPKRLTHISNAAARVRALARSKQFAEMLALVAPLVQESPESDELWVLQGTAQLGLERAQDAIASFENGLRHTQKSADHVRLLGDALMGAGRNEEALARYREALELDPQDGQTHSHMGMYYARIGKPELALEHFTRFAALEPTSPNAHTNLANALFGVSRFDEGIGHLQTALRLDPKCAPALQSSYVVYRQRNQRAQAIEALRSGVAALPRDAFFRTRLARELATWANSKDAALEEAVQLAREVQAQSPDDPLLLDLLGVALARRGEFPAAIESATSAASLARTRGAGQLADAIQARIGLYRNRQPYVE